MKPLKISGKRLLAEKWTRTFGGVTAYKNTLYYDYGDGVLE